MKPQLKTGPFRVVSHRRKMLLKWSVRPQVRTVSSDYCRLLKQLR